MSNDDLVKFPMGLAPPRHDNGQWYIQPETRDGTLMRNRFKKNFLSMFVQCFVYDRGSQDNQTKNLQNM